MRLIPLSVAALCALASFASAAPDNVSTLIPRLLDDAAELYRPEAIVGSSRTSR